MSIDFSDLYQDDSELLNEEEKKKYSALIGGLIFIMKTRPDIAFAVNRLATRTCKSTKRDYLALLRVLKYLVSTKHLGLVFRKNNSLDNMAQIVSLCAYVDAACNV
jgi:hypothetical protein